MFWLHVGCFDMPHRAHEPGRGTSRGLGSRCRSGRVIHIPDLLFPQPLRWFAWCYREKPNTMVKSLVIPSRSGYRTLWFVKARWIGKWLARPVVLLSAYRSWTCCKSPVWRGHIQLILYLSRNYCDEEGGAPTRHLRRYGFSYKKKVFVPIKGMNGWRSFGRFSIWPFVFIRGRCFGYQPGTLSCRFGGHTGVYYTQPRIFGNFCPHDECGK